MKGTASGLLTRSLAAAALVFFYGLSAMGISTFVLGTPKAEAGRGGRRGGGRGFRGGFRGFRGGRRGFRGRRGGIWFGAPALYSYSYYDDGCYWSPRRGRWICPYSYYPGYYRYYW
jgi:hypothetical protein